MGQLEGHDTNVAMSEPFVDMLTGGHPNSLGRTIEVVDQVLATPDRIDELYWSSEARRISSTVS